MTIKKDNVHNENFFKKMVCVDMLKCICFLIFIYLIIIFYYFSVFPPRILTLHITIQFFVSGTA